MMTTPRWLIAGLCGLALCAQARDIYEWKDAKGVTHIGDMVPAPYASTAKKRDVTILNRGFNLPAAPAKPETAITPSEQPKPAQAAASAPASAAPPMTVMGDAASASCARQKKAYEDSLACFARHRQGNRLVGDYASCPVAPQPNC